MSVQVTKHGFTYQSITDASLEQAAADVWLRATPTSGQAFARKIHAGEPETKLEKNRARHRVLDHFGRYKGHLKIVTLPGVKWSFEKDLLNRRSWGRPTTIYAAECDPAIYRAAVLAMNFQGGAVVEQIPNDNLVFRAGKIGWFEQVRIEQMILRTKAKMTGAWIDLTGPITDTIADALKSLWSRVSDSLIVTFLASRYDGQVSVDYHNAEEDWGRFFSRMLKVPASRIAVYSYIEGYIKMMQITIMKPSCMKRKALEQPLPSTQDFIPVEGILTDWPLPSIRPFSLRSLR